MPSFMIHLCVAKEYVRKYNVENEEEFIKGTIYPDLTDVKGKTHYSPCYSADTDLYQFLLHETLDSSFQEGYFQHLLADFLFYHKYFFGWKTKGGPTFYRDYGILNPKLRQKYNITQFPKEVENLVLAVEEGKTVEYHYDKVVQFIEDVSNYELHKLAERILREKDFKFLLK